MQDSNEFDCINLLKNINIFKNYKILPQKSHWLKGPKDKAEKVARWAVNLRD